MPKKKVVYAGFLHDSYTDENGKEIKYTGQIAGIWETKESFYAVDFDGFISFKRRIQIQSYRRNSVQLNGVAANK